MKYLLLYLCLIFIIPLTGDTKLTSEIIYVTSLGELWITRINNTDNAQPFLKIENDDFRGYSASICTKKWSSYCHLRS